LFWQYSSERSELFTIIGIAALFIVFPSATVANENHPIAKHKVFFVQIYEQTSKVPFFREAIIPHHNDKSNPGLLSPAFFEKLSKI
jgi:hypothetical protein